MADVREYFGEHSMRALISLVKSAMTGMISKSDIINALNSTDTDKALSAAQGKALNDLVTGLQTSIDSITGESGSVANAEKLGGLTPDEYVQVTQVLTDWADLNAEKLQVPSVDLLKAVRAQVNAMQGLDADGNPLVAKTAAENAKEALATKAAELKDGKDDTVKGAIDTALGNANTNIDAATDDAGVTTAFQNGWAAIYTAAGVTENVPAAPDVEATTADPMKVDMAKDSEKLGGHAPEYYATADALKTQLTDKVGQANGLATLDENGLIPASNLPSYVDDVIESYYDADADKMYSDEAKTTEITGETGKIYVDPATRYTYRFSGTGYVKLPGEDMMEITDADVKTLWDSVVVHSVTFFAEDGSVANVTAVVDGEKVANPDGGTYNTDAGVAYDFDAPVTADLKLTKQAAVSAP